MNAPDTVRIRLDEAAGAALTQMTSVLAAEGQHLSLAPSKVVSLIVSDYAERYFTRDKSRLMEALLDRKALLKAMLSEVKDGSEEEIEKLRTILTTLGQKRPRPSDSSKKPAAPQTVRMAEAEKEDRKAAFHHRDGAMEKIRR